MMHHVKHIYLWLWPLFFKNSLAIQHTNNHDWFKPHCFVRPPGPDISAPMACLAAAGLSEMGTNVLCLPVWGKERQGERERKKAEEERKEEGREKEADGARGRHVVAACQLLIRALVCPLWAGVRD